MDAASYSRDMKNAIRVVLFLVFAIGLALGLIFGLLIWAVL